MIEATTEINIYACEMQIFYLFLADFMKALE